MEEEKKAPVGPSGPGENLYAVLSYLWVFCLIPVLMRSKSDFVRFHARQGLMLFIIEVGIGIIGIIPVLGPLVILLGVLVCGLLSLTGIVQVLMGNKWKMPIIGDWSEKLNV